MTGTAIREFFAGSFDDRMFATMTPVEHVVELAGRRLEHETFALDFIELGRQFGIEVDPRTLAI